MNELRPKLFDVIKGYTKEQLMNSKTLGLPRDAVAAVLQDGAVYTKDQASGLVQEFLNRRV